VRWAVRILPEGQKQTSVFESHVACLLKLIVLGTDGVGSRAHWTAGALSLLACTRTIVPPLGGAVMEALADENGWTVVLGKDHVTFDVRGEV